MAKHCSRIDIFLSLLPCSPIIFPSFLSLALIYAITYSLFLMPECIDFHTSSVFTVFGLIIVLVSQSLSYNFFFLSCNYIILLLLLLLFLMLFLLLLLLWMTKLSDVLLKHQRCFFLNLVLILFQFS